MVFASLLKQTGIKIDKAASGDEGIALAQEKHYDIIFLDHMMPDKDGIETLHELKEDPTGTNWDTPYICLTANAISGAREEYIKAGFDDYLTKPINTDELEYMLIRYLPKEKILKGQDTAEPEDKQRKYENGKNVNPGRDGGSRRADSLPGDVSEAFKKLSDSGINILTGIDNNGSFDSYIAVLEIFFETMEEKKDEIEEFYNKGDIKNYTIKVHALKSSARIIGATDFGEEAQMLEDAGKRDDIDYIRKHHEAFIERFMGFKEPLLRALGKNGESKRDNKSELIADSAVMAAAYEEMRAAAADMDCDRLDRVFDEMKDYQIPDNERELFNELSTAALNFDYDMILKLLEGK
jgi:CheY-like chemotaxis protein